jgi:protein ATS1
MLLLQALGSNGSGQLGIGHKDDVSTAQNVLLPSSLTASNTGTHPAKPQPHAKLIVAGGNHTLLLLSSGELFWTGDASSGACGPFPDANDPQTTPTFRPVHLGPHLPEGTKVELAAATWAASVAVVAPPTPVDGASTTSATTTTPSVYSFGSGDRGELGLGPGTARVCEATQIYNFPPVGTHVIDLVASMGHVVAVLSNGEAWGWGNGRKGQLGSPATAAVHAPRRIQGVNFRVIKAVCGREFTCLFGAPETGDMAVLGSDKWGVRSQAPGPESLAGWKEVGAGWGCVFVLKEDGMLLSWGRNDHGQLAPECLPRIRSIAVGSEHTLALTEEGDVLAWGWGEHGNCGPMCDVDKGKGHRNRIASTKATLAAQGAEITMLGAGCATSWVVMEKVT